MNGTQSECYASNSLDLFASFSIKGKRRRANYEETGKKTLETLSSKELKFNIRTLVTIRQRPPMIKINAPEKAPALSLAAQELYDTFSSIACKES